MARPVSCEENPYTDQKDLVITGNLASLDKEDFFWPFKATEKKI